jgi:predicted esterase
MPTSPDHPHQGQPVLRAGAALGQARAAAILVHGRGGTAQSMFGFVEALAVPGLAFLAPQAAGRTWYPQRFIAPLAANEPWLSSALQTVADVLAECQRSGIGPERIVVAGFSQGACLSLEFAARNPRRYGGVIAFSGGLIGPPELPRRIAGDLAGTPIFLGCSDEDAHIPVASVHASSAAFRAAGAAVTEKIYPGMGHEIVEDELEHARAILGAL